MHVYRYLFQIEHFGVQYGINPCSRDPAGRPISTMFRRMGGMLFRTACPDVADRPTKYALHGRPATLRHRADMRYLQTMAHISGIKYMASFWCTVWNSCSRNPAGRPISTVVRTMGGMLIRTASPDVADLPTKHAEHGGPAILHLCTDLREWQQMAHISGTSG